MRGDRADSDREICRNRSVNALSPVVSSLIDSLSSVSEICYHRNDFETPVADEVPGAIQQIAHCP